MTTSWSHFARLEWLRSFQANVGGFLLATLAVGFAPIAIRAGWTGRMPAAQIQQGVTLLVLSIAAISLTQWITRLM